MPLLFLSLRSLVFDMPNTTALSFRLDGRAVQGAGFRHQSLRRRGFKSHSNHKLFFFCDVEKNLNVLPCSESSSELAQRKRVGLITQRSQDRNLDSLITSRLAQLVERKTLNLVVVGSSPTVGILFFYFFARSSKKIKNKNASTGTRTRILTLEGLNTTLVLWTQSLGPLRCHSLCVHSRHRLALAAAGRESALVSPS